MTREEFIANVRKNLKPIQRAIDQIWLTTYTYEDGGRDISPDAKANMYENMYNAVEDFEDNCFMGVLPEDTIENVWPVLDTEIKCNIAEYSKQSTIQNYIAMNETEFVVSNLAFNENLKSEVAEIICYRFPALRESVLQNTVLSPEKTLLFFNEGNEKLRVSILNNQNLSSETLRDLYLSLNSQNNFITAEKMAFIQNGNTPDDIIDSIWLGLSNAEKETAVRDYSVHYTSLANSDDYQWNIKELSKYNKSKVTEKFIEFIIEQGDRGNLNSYNLTNYMKAIYLDTNNEQLKQIIDNNRIRWSLTDQDFYNNVVALGVFRGVITSEQAVQYINTYEYDENDYTEISSEVIPESYEPAHQTEIESEPVKSGLSGNPLQDIQNGKEKAQANNDPKDNPMLIKPTSTIGETH